MGRVIGRFSCPLVLPTSMDSPVSLVLFFHFIMTLLCWTGYILFLRAITITAIRMDLYEEEEGAHHFANAKGSRRRLYGFSSSWLLCYKAGYLYSHSVPSFSPERKESFFKKRLHRENGHIIFNMKGDKIMEDPPEITKERKRLLFTTHKDERDKSKMA